MSYEGGIVGPTGPTGPAGTNGTEYIARGVYTYSTSAPPSYIANDLVLNTVQVTDNLSTPLNTPDNNTYVCIQSLGNIYGAPGPLDPNDPTWVNYWQVFVNGGPTGATGPEGPALPLYQATYYKTVLQNLTSSITDITFDVDASWNNTNGYINHSSGSENFEVVQEGLYQLEFNASILANGATWASLNKSISIDITRSPTAEVVAIPQNTSIPSTSNYSQSVCATFKLEAGDVINCRVVNAFVGGPAYVNSVQNTIDLNTWFTWRYVTSGPVGPTGANGTNGTNGTNGASAVTTWLADGTIGTNPDSTYFFQSANLVVGSAIQIEVATTPYSGSTPLFIGKLQSDLATGLPVAVSIVSSDGSQTCTIRVSSLQNLMGFYNISGTVLSTGDVLFIADTDCSFTSDLMSSELIASGFSEGITPTTLTDNGPNGTVIGTGSITTVSAGFLMAFVVANFVNASNAEEIINMYVVIGGDTSGITKQTIIKNQAGFDGYAPISIVQRTANIASPGTHTCTVYAFTETASTGITCDHVDIGIIGNLANY
jgi:hypothetical protein